MDLFQKGVLTLIKSSLTGEKYSLPENFDFSRLLKISGSHKIAPMLYYGLINCGYESDASAQKLFLDCCMYISVSVGQLYALDEMFGAFENNGIDYLPLKGVTLKKIYPKPEMRRMGDADILIRENQYDKIKAVLPELGFQYEYETDHEIVWKKPSLVLELHKKIVPERDSDLHSYFGDGWGLAIQNAQTPNLHSFSTEIQFINLFIHLVKHYRSGGIGISHMVDLWVYRRHNPGMDRHFIIKELKKLYLDEFYANVNQTLEVWFDDAESTDMTDFITDVIFENGVYGTHSARILSYAAKNKKRNSDKNNSYFAKVIRLIFPSAKSLYVKYPVLKKCGILLPVIWFIRWFDVLLFNRGRIITRKEDIKLTNDENLTEFEQALNFVGLDYRLKEE